MRSCRSSSNFRHSRRHLAPWRKRAVSRPRAPESESMRLLMGRTLQLATAAISELIKKIPVDASVEYVSALLSFYNDFYEGITCKLLSLLMVECSMNCRSFRFIRKCFSCVTILLPLWSAEK